MKSLTEEHKEYLKGLPNNELIGKLETITRVEFKDDEVYNCKYAILYTDKDYLTGFELLYVADRLKDFRFGISNASSNGVRKLQFEVFNPENE